MPQFLLPVLPTALFVTVFQFLTSAPEEVKKLILALVSEVAGLAGREALYKLTDCINNQDSSSAMSVISELYQNSYDMERLCVEMINHLRNFLIVKTVKDSRGLIICTDDEYNSIVSSAESFTLECYLCA